MCILLALIILSMLILDCFEWAFKATRTAASRGGVMSFTFVLHVPCLADYVVSAMFAYFRLKGGAHGTIVSYNISSRNGENIAEPQLLEQVATNSERALIQVQLITWYIVCPCSLVVTLIYWSSLVRTKEYCEAYWPPHPVLWSPFIWKPE